MLVSFKKMMKFCIGLLKSGGLAMKKQNGQKRVKRFISVWNAQNFTKV